MRRVVLGAVAVLTSAGALAACSPAAMAADACPNAAYRNGAGANLADCRAWEQVTPADKGGNQTKIADGAFPSPDGNTVLSGANGDVGGADAITQLGVFSSVRGAAWLTAGIDAPLDTPLQGPGTAITSQPTLGFSEDRSKAAVITTRKLAPGAVEGDSNLYVRDTRDRSYTLAATVPGPRLSAQLSGLSAQSAFFASSPDFKHFVFYSPLELEPNAPNGGLYLVSGGRVTLQSRANNGEPFPGPQGTNFPDAGHQLVSADGRRVTFSVLDPNTFQPLLYQRVDNSSTVLLSRSHVSGPDEGTPVALGDGEPAAWGSVDGREVTFAARNDAPLTDDARPSHFYRWSAATDTLTNLFDGVTPQDAGPGAVLLGVSPDGRYVWYTDAALDGNGNSVQSINVLDTREKRVLKKATTPADSGLLYTDYRLSNDGTKLVALSRREFTGYDQEGENCENIGGGFCAEAFVFDATSSDTTPVCASCGAPGTHSVGETHIATGYRPGRPRVTAVSNGGRVFFDTPQRLVTADSNRLADVYEYAPGQGRALVSSGTGRYPASMGGTTPSGDDVFFFTADSLVPQDDDGGAADLYDARVGGGLASQQVAPGRGLDACVSANCPGPRPAAPAAETPGTATFQRPAPAPAFRVSRVSGAARRAAASSGRLRVSVQVGAAGRLSARAAARVSGRRVTVGRDSVSARKAGRYTLVLSLSASARRSLARGGKLGLGLSVAYSRAAKPATQSFTLAASRARRSARGGAR